MKTLENILEHVLADVKLEIRTARFRQRLDDQDEKGEKYE